MAEYIEKSNLYNKICERVNNHAIRSWLVSIINDIPAADVAPVVHGKLKYVEKKIRYCYCAICSVCGRRVEAWDFCSNCGAKMEMED